MSQRITDMEMYSLLETVFDFFFVVLNTLGQGTFI